MKNFDREQLWARWLQMADADRFAGCIGIIRAVLESGLVPSAHSSTGPVVEVRGNVTETDGARTNCLKFSRGENSDHLMEWKGELWLVRFDTEEGFVRDLVGVRYIALLVRNAGQTWSHYELGIGSGRLTHPPPSGREPWVLEWESAPVSSPTSWQPVWDAQTFSSVRSHLAEVKARIRAGDGTPYEIAELNDQVQDIERAIKGAESPAGRPRQFREKKRGMPNPKSVGKAISTAVHQIRRCGLPMLADHLDHSIDPYAQSLVYRPGENAVTWDIYGPPLLTPEK